MSERNRQRKKSGWQRVGERLAFLLQNDFARGFAFGAGTLAGKRTMDKVFDAPMFNKSSRGSGNVLPFKKAGSR